MLKDQCYVDSHSYYYFEGDIKQIIHNLTKLYADGEAAGFSNIRIVWSSGYSSDDVEWSAVGDRLETDREYDARLKTEKRVAAQRKKDRLIIAQQERKEYERLRKKFEKQK